MGENGVFAKFWNKLRFIKHENKTLYYLNHNKTSVDITTKFAHH